MSKLVIQGSKKYCKRMEKHLRKEHPSTKSRMKVVGRETHHFKEKKREGDSLFDRAVKSSKKKPYFAWR